MDCSSRTRAANTPIRLASFMAISFLAALLPISAYGAETAASEPNAKTETSSHKKHGEKHHHKSHVPESSPKKISKSSTLVHAKPEVVYKSILALRGEADDSVKELSCQGNTFVVEERFDGLPVIGAAVCTYKEVHTPNKQIEYKMVKSDKFKAFEGKWEILPADSAEHCIVSLSSYVDLAIPIPFSGHITRAQTKKGVNERLHAVKKSCEATPSTAEDSSKKSRATTKQASKPSTSTKKIL